MENRTTFSTFELRYEDDIAIITLIDRRVYLNRSEQFRDEIHQFLQRGDRKVIVDLSNVNVMNSVGLGVLIALQNRLQQQQGCVKITGLRPLMKDIFARMRLEELLDIEADVQAALESLRK